MSEPEPPLDHERLVALEERLTFQQRLIEELNEVALGHQRRIEQLGRELARYVATVDRLVESPQGEELPHEKPPHY